MDDSEALQPPERRRKSRYQEWCDGELSTWDLDDEEVDRGFPRDREGKFNGRGPAVIPRARYAELYQRRQERDVRAIRDLTPTAVDTLRFTMLDPDVPTSDKLRAVALVLERSVPKVTETVELAVTERRPWEDVMLTAIRRVEPIEEAEVVDP